MERMFLAPGFRFHPTDVELILYYLKRKIMGKKLHVEAIAEIELYKFDPWDLPAKSCLKSGDLEWYFFCPKYRKYSNGPRTNRATEHGYWKTTGVDKHICHNSKTIGKRKTLVFHEGRAPRGRKTNWVMYEYRLEDKNLVPAGIIQDTYVLCKIFEKSGSGPKNGEQYGAPYREEDWEDNEVSHSLASFPAADPCSSSLAQAEEHHPPLRKDTDIVSLLDMFDNDDGATVSNSNVGNEVYAIYKGLPDLGSPSDLKINIHLPDSMETEFTPGAKLLENDKSFLELNDLAYPLDSFAEKNGHLTLDSYACSNDFNNFDGCCDAGLPASELSLYHPLYTEGSEVPNELLTFVEGRGLEGDGSQGNKAAMCDLAGCSVREAEGRQMKYFQQATARGERQTGAYSGLHILLESIPTYSTSATGFPSPNGGERLKVGSLLSTCSGSFIHVEAGVYVWWECTDEALPESPGEFSCLPCGRELSRRELRKLLVTCSNNAFLFLFSSRSGFILSRCQILQVAWNLLQCSLPLVNLLHPIQLQFIGVHQLYACI